MAKTEADIQTATERALQRLGYWPKPLEHYTVEEWDEEKAIRCSECGHRGAIKFHIKHESFSKQPGRPDLIVPNPRAAVGGIAYCEMEVKAVGKDVLRFNFADVREAQYKFMNNWVSAGGIGFLTVGKIIKTTHGTAIHSIYVIPWEKFIAFKEHCEKTGEIGLPYSLSLYKRLPDSGILNDIGFFTPAWCLLIKDEEGEFHFHPEHPLAHGLNEVEPFYKRMRKEKA